MSRSRLRVVSIVVLSVLVAGCGGKRLPVHYYALGPADLSSSTWRSNDDAGLDVGVHAFHVEPPYARDKIVYRIGEQSPEVAFYAYHRWAGPLSRMMSGVVSAALAGTPGLRSIEPVAPGSDYRAILGGRVVALEEIDLPDGQQVRASIALTLRLDDGTELWSEVLSGTSSLRTDEVGDIVDAMRALLVELLEESRPGFEQALSAHSR